MATVQLYGLTGRMIVKVPAGPTAAPRPPSHLLSHWLQRLNQATKKESPGCLQASVISNLFRLLTRDLRCVARPDLCA
ncbi:Interleukin-28A [Fukomys damarensis]|uniref:Interleukin-28A n=1 Tax=Fukomys damarensis TaxID=885580 RepID=A0A091D873_FUKDA|nr:Interleukin-28A [Fukomys damarensis]